MTPLSSPRILANPHTGFLSWDSESGERLHQNLLLPNSGIHFRTGDQSLEAEVVRSGEDSFSIQTKVAGPVLLELSFDLSVTPVTAFPLSASDQHLPLLLSAPDFGLVRLETLGTSTTAFRLEGDRGDKALRLTLQFDPAESRPGIRLSVLSSPEPDGVSANEWTRARRAWMNAFQRTVKWGRKDDPFSSPPGLLANNVVSDPVSFALYFYADHAFFYPEPLPGFPLYPHIQKTLEYWLEDHINPAGESEGYRGRLDFLDANASLLISAWSLVTQTGDWNWFQKYRKTLLKLGRFLVDSDANGDGILESVRSGTPGTLIEPQRSCSWWDALNCGHQDAYCNLLAFRALHCLADLLGEDPEATSFRKQAESIRNAFVSTFLNPESGLLAWWRDQEDTLHDFHSPFINGLAIEYGLVEPALAEALITRLLEEIDEVGFHRFDLGIPPQLIPVPRGDYLIGQWNEPEDEAGLSTFQTYMNAGLFAGHSLPFLVALHMTGHAERADAITKAMLDRAFVGGFQNGVVDDYGKGGDWTDWQGNPCGYEGYLADNYRFLQILFTKQKAHRDRLYRSMRISNLWAFRASVGETPTNCRKT